jgi:CBS domain-containing protein
VTLDQKPDRPAAGLDAFGERFLSAFRGIENHLRSELGAGGEMPFGSMLRATNNRVALRYTEDLREFADLRNAISHRRTDVLLANPTEAATTKLEQVFRTLTDPPRLDSVLGTRIVTFCQPSSGVREAASLMRVGNFSQIPVYDDGRYVALLTAETLARWLAAELERYNGLLEDVTVAEALAHTEDHENSAFLPRSATVFDALDLFGEFSVRGKTLDAILVTNDGRPTAPLNIVTIYDVPDLLQRIPGGGTRLLV